MSCSAFHRVAGIAFAAVALAHLSRALYQVPIDAGGTRVPLWISWVAVAGAGALSGWAFASRPKPGEP